MFGKPSKIVVLSLDREAKEGNDNLKNGKFTSFLNESCPGDLNGRPFFWRAPGMALQSKRMGVVQVLT